jgi:two-component system catabolic regulation response regulator CreB
MKTRILILEDEPSIADALRFSLEQEGFIVEHAETLKKAREYFTAQTFDFLILDVGLPDGSGFEFCKEVRKSSGVPLLFLTARQEEVDRIVGLEIGGDDYVTKPFSPRELISRIRAILRRSQTHSKPSFDATPPSLNSNDSLSSESQKDNSENLLRINPERREIQLNQQKLDLTRNEYLLLEFLYQHPVQVFSRRQLMEAVWDEPDSATERTVDAHIKTLRKKMKNAFPEELIRTHRGFGYSMELPEP